MSLAIICRGIRRGVPYELPALVDREDYEWAMEQGSWFMTHDKRGPCYAARSYTNANRPEGVSKGLMWLHKAVLLRAEGPPPTPLHIIGDHRNGVRYDCRRQNLRWATVQMNNANRYGIAWLQPELPGLLAVHGRIEARA